MGIGLTQEADSSIRSASGGRRARPTWPGHHARNVGSGWRGPLSRVLTGACQRVLHVVAVGGEVLVSLELVKPAGECRLDISVDIGAKSEARRCDFGFECVHNGLRHLCRI